MYSPSQFNSKKAPDSWPTVWGWEKVGSRRSTLKITKCCLSSPFPISQAQAQAPPCPGHKIPSKVLRVAYQKSEIINAEFVKPDLPSGRVPT